METKKERHRFLKNQLLQNYKAEAKEITKCSRCGSFERTSYDSSKDRHLCDECAKIETEEEGRKNLEEWKKIKDYEKKSEQNKKFPEEHKSTEYQFSRKTKPSEPQYELLSQILENNQKQHDEICQISNDVHIIMIIMVIYFVLFLISTIITILALSR